MLLAALVPKLIGFRACIPRSLSATISSSSSSSSGSSTSVNDNKRQLRPLTLDESLQLKDKSSYLHAAHCLLYCKITDNDAECIFGLCQVRFDGKLGFPGGAVGNKYEEIHETGDIIKGLERELEEEINYTSMPSESLTHENNGYIHNQ
ncbi:U8 snoRNA-decapping enzyme-like [Panonychus citri]|uniref:U8 snoRNA-decapping enzyme-like n=1 Tax=Panonychus citri TaxID=50023 RepID=UPI0023078D3A|nr:U8 snoRNA-decapping enzyme-like [Panonychus citri]